MLEAYRWNRFSHSRGKSSFAEGVREFSSHNPEAEKCAEARCAKEMSVKLEEISEDCLVE